MTLGEFLRNERELRGITIEQVASATKVGVRTLHALEGDHYAELPAKPYIRGFVTSYCRFIGLDPKEIRSRFESFISKKTQELPNRDGGHSGYAFEKKDGEQQSRTILLIAICSFIAVGGLAVIFLKPSLRHHRTSHIDRLRAAQSFSPTDTENSSALLAVMPSVLPISTPSIFPSASVAVVEAVTPKVSPTPQGVVKVVAQEVSRVSESVEESSESQDSAHQPPPGIQVGASPDDPLDSGLGLSSADIHHKVIFKVLADIWVRYQVDDRPVRKFIVRKGKVLVLRAKNKVNAQVSNPHSVLYSYNSKDSTLVAGSKSLKMMHGVGVMSFPQFNGESKDEFFKVNMILPKTPDPVPDDNSRSLGQ
jgi:cytoskeletal protein RodZ